MANLITPVSLTNSRYDFFGGFTDIAYRPGTADGSFVIANEERSVSDLPLHVSLLSFSVDGAPQPTLYSTPSPTPTEYLEGMEALTDGTVATLYRLDFSTGIYLHLLSPAGGSTTSLLFDETMSASGILVQALSNGNFVVFYADNETSSPVFKTLVLGPAGAVVEPARVFTSTVPVDTIYARGLVGLNDGNFGVGFITDDRKAYFQFMNADGTSGSAILLDSPVMGDPIVGPFEMTQLRGGQILVVYEQYFDDYASSKVVGQVLNSDGSMAAGPLRLDDSGDLAYSGYPSVAATADGGFVVVWTDYGGNNVGQMRRFGADFQPMGDAERVSTSAPGGESNLEIAIAPDGSMLVTWFDFDDAEQKTRAFDVTPVPSAFDDTLMGSALDDTVDLLAGDDIYYSRDGNDSIFGNSGHDTIVGGGGDDSLVGGDGDDKLVGEAGDDNLFGGAGGDNLLGGGGLDNMSGGDGDDVMKGKSGDDTMSGDGGNDSLVGNGGADTMSGGDGNDKMAGSSGNDVMHGDGGNDTVLGGGGNDKMYGDDGDDRLLGKSGNDAMRGGSGDDALIGGGGNDRMFGQGGDDNLRGGSGSDRLKGNGGADVLSGGGGNDKLYGGGGNDKLYGKAGADDLYGGSGDDIIKGNGGNDRLYASGGDDVMTGGSGADIFVFNRSTGDNVITDFQVGTDKLGFKGPADGFNYDFSEVGGDLVIDYSFARGNSVVEASLTLENVQLVDIQGDGLL